MVCESERARLQEQARHARWLAWEVADDLARAALLALAEEYEARAATAEAATQTKQ